jgi:hypothetical protein
MSCRVDYMYSSSCPQASILCLHDEPGKAVPAELFQGKDAVDFVPVRMKPDTSATAAIRPVDKGAENAVFSGVGLLLVVAVPDLFLKGEFGKGEFAGQGRVAVESDQCFARPAEIRWDTNPPGFFLKELEDKNENNRQCILNTPFGVSRYRLITQ